MFANQTKDDGFLISKKGLEFALPQSEKIKNYSYSLREKADFNAIDIRIENGNYVFDLESVIEDVKDVEYPFPGLHNVENAIAASAAAQLYGVSASELKNALLTFKGVKRRFDYRIKTKKNYFY